MVNYALLKWAVHFDHGAARQVKTLKDGDAEERFTPTAFYNGSAPIRSSIEATSRIAYEAGVEPCALNVCPFARASDLVPCSRALRLRPALAISPQTTLTFTCF